MKNLLFLICIVIAQGCGKSNDPSAARPNEPIPETTSSAVLTFSIDSTFIRIAVYVNYWWLANEGGLDAKQDTISLHAKAFDDHRLTDPVSPYGSTDSLNSLSITIGKRVFSGRGRIYFDPKGVESKYLGASGSLTGTLKDNFGMQYTILDGSFQNVGRSRY